jgi:hypothetical protein
MDLFFGFFGLPTWVVVFVLLILTSAAALAPVFIRRRVSLERLVLNNEVAGFKYATLGVIYAVLLGFVVITVWEQYEDAEEHVREESGVLEALIQLGRELPEEARQPALDAMRAYLRAVIHDEWPAMAARRGESAEATAALKQLQDHYLDFGPGSARETTLLDKSFDLVIRLSETRQERLAGAEGALPPVLGALLVGALLTIGFTLFFGAPNVIAQGAMTGIICLMVLLVLSAALMLNRPYSGDVSVSPRPLEEVLEQIDADAPAAGGYSGARGRLSAMKRGPAHG